MAKNIYVTDRDLDRLERLIELSAKSANIVALENEVARATVVPAEKIPADVVTMNSRVRFRDERTGEESEVTLVYPKESDVSSGKISITAPVGTALLGLAVGDVIEWSVPSGKQRTLKIIEILFQPEASGNFQL